VSYIGGSNEVTRTLYACFIVFLDLFCMVQDWEFPLFSEDHHHAEDRAKIAGTDSNSLKIGRLTISAKWMQYGPLLGIMGADFAFVKSMFSYTPNSYGEYTDPRDQTIWCVTNETLLDYVYPLGSNTDPDLLGLISFEARHNMTTYELLPGCKSDVHTTSRFINSGWDKFAAILSVFIFLGFLRVVRTSMKEAHEEEIAVWGEDDHEAIVVYGAGSKEANGVYKHVHEDGAAAGTYEKEGSNMAIVHHRGFWLLGMYGRENAPHYGVKSHKRVCPLTGWIRRLGSDPMPSFRALEEDEDAEELQAKFNEEAAASKAKMGKEPLLE
jgi:hypothetical protein